jgi:hypothetical protein
VAICASHDRLQPQAAVLGHGAVAVNVIPPAIQIVQPQHRRIVSLYDSAEKLRLVVITDDRRLEVKLNANPIEFARAPLDPAR